MNEQNTLRYYLSKLKKSLKTGKILINMSDMYDYISDHYCYKCIHDDFGYCGLRNDYDISDYDIYMKFCCPQAIKYIENKLDKLINKKEL